jgi:ABC-type glycerol-3-phosphate transport system substrate-binding protein
LRCCSTKHLADRQQASQHASATIIIFASSRIILASFSHHSRIIFSFSFAFLMPASSVPSVPSALSRFSVASLRRAALRWLALGAVLAMLGVSLLASSCDDSRDGASGTPALTFWHFRSEPIHRDAMKAMIARFEQDNGCKVTVAELSWGDGKTKLLAAFNTDKAPDVIELGSDWVAQFSHAGVLRNLSGDGMRLDKFAPFAAPAALYNGSTYALPWTVDTRVLFFNKTLLRQAGLPPTAPETFNDLYAACERIRALNTSGGAVDSLTGKPANKQTDVYGFGVNGSDEHRLYKKILSFFWSAGGDVFDANGKPVVNSPQNVAALSAYIALARCGFVETQRQLDDMFARGSLGFVISGSWLLDKIEKENKSLDFGTALVPALRGHSVAVASAESDEDETEPEGAVTGKPAAKSAEKIAEKIAEKSPAKPAEKSPAKPLAKPAQQTPAAAPVPANSASVAPVALAGQAVSFAGAQYLAVSAKTKQAELAKKLIRYLTNGKTTLDFCKTSNESGFPAAKDYIADPYFETFPHRMTFAKQLASARMAPVHPRWLDIEKIIEEAAVEALLGRRGVQGALDRAQYQILDLLQKRSF